jgi:hypothetical protein
MVSNLNVKSKQALIVEQEQQQKQKPEVIDNYVPICGGNFKTPVINPVKYLDEIKYMIGKRLYVEHAD